MSKINTFLIENQEDNDRKIYDHELNVEELYKSAKHDCTKDYSTPPIVLKVGPNIWGTSGNFSVITGKAKSKKTFLVSAVISTLLTNKQALKQLQGSLMPPNTKILHFDTEQASHHLQDVVNRSFTLAGIDSSNYKDFDVFNLRKFNVEERNLIINHAIESTPNVGAVIIDGIKDLIYDINNMYESTDLITSILKWTQEKGIHIIVVLHQNKTDNHVRGNIGTEALNKCETLITVTESSKDKRISEVIFSNTRNESPESFAFRIDDSGMPVECPIPAKLQPRKKTTPEDYNTDDYNEVLNKAFAADASIDNITLKKHFAQEFGIGSNKCLAFIKYCLDDIKLITKSTGKKNKSIYQRNKDPS